MGQQILIAYESATGTTKEVCETIAETLEVKGYDLVLTTMTSVRDLHAYDHILLASPINGMSWLQGPKDFLVNHTPELIGKDVGLIYVSYVLKTGSGFWRKTIRKGMEKLANPLKITLIQGFGGKVEAPFGTVPRLIFGISKAASSDVRDLEDVKRFAEDLALKWQD